LKISEKKNSEIQVAVANQKFPNSIGNGQGNNPETGLLCPQISSNVGWSSREEPFVNQYVD